MKNTTRRNKNNPDPYEDSIRKEKLDPYEALIKSNVPLKHIDKLV